MRENHHDAPYSFDSIKWLVSAHGHRGSSIDYKAFDSLRAAVESWKIFRTCSGFKTGEKLAAYCGSAPPVYQSAGKLIAGHITKHGSTHVRRMPNWGCTRTKADSKLKRFYFRIKSSNRAKVAIVALARKVICILHHLIVNREMFEDKTANKCKPENLPGLPHRMRWK